ncbi:diguanylate cyclase [Brucepastera parasyntrophica]|uniref:sensor domain-containing diguanylate cyclase n=1 Tax=Brucepastera parasyntrophica TaxID=2880008 RepID=UPI00210E00A3|nr:diguanylate cyclase [Brucepastera parasyntrophica]ULQ60236.1 diguanylate cyclase [Brucepastera parasyntrophica]
MYTYRVKTNRNIYGKIGEQGSRTYKKLLNDPSVPELDDELKTVSGLQELHDQLVVIRDVLFSFSRGDLSPYVSTRGFIAGSIKALQAHLRHMVWQVQQVEQGDFTQRVEFLGDFSAAFNNMVVRLDNTLKTLHQNEKKLLSLTDNLRNEVNLRDSAMEEIQESEARFKYLASHDPLTGVFNRRSFMDRVIAELKVAKSNSMPCCLALLDIDFFKKFNDTHGHLLGDEALKHVVKIAVGVLRSADFMGRYGGEEFIFLFVNADINQGYQIAERIRKAIITSPLENDGKILPLTVSVGVSVIQPDDKIRREEDIISLADEALYEAKKTGRNRVICLSPLLPDITETDKDPFSAAPAMKNISLNSSLL